MTETTVAYQTGFAALGVSAEVAGDIIDKCRAMLLEDPVTREDYEQAWLAYLVRYHGLPLEAAQQILWCVQVSGAPGFRTVANRCQELMRADARLQPSRDVMEARQRQRRQGRVR